VLAQRSELRIATTREFAARVLAPRLEEFLGERGGAVAGHDALGLGGAPLVSVLTAESGVEASLLAGQADIGFDCGRPRDPLIRFRAVTPEPFAVVIAPKVARRHGVRSADDLLGLARLEYNRAPAATLLRLTRDARPCAVAFNDIASTREAAVAGIGWAILPSYAVAREVESGALIEIKGARIAPERFGVWWLATRPGLQPWVQRAEAWLRGQNLSEPSSVQRRSRRRGGGAREQAIARTRRPS
jgi:DNA-binding transcriptional LysR family regulator